MVCLLIINRKAPITQEQDWLLRSQYGVECVQQPGTGNFLLPGNAAEITVPSLHALQRLLEVLGPCELMHRPAGQIPGGAFLEEGFTIIVLNRNPKITILSRK